MNTIASTITQFLNSLPTGVDIQFIQDIQGSGNASIISQYKTLQSSNIGEVSHDLLKARVNHLRNDDANGDLPSHTLKIFVRRPLTAFACERDSDCPSHQYCINDGSVYTGRCANRETYDGPECHWDSHCTEGYIAAEANAYLVVDKAT